MHLVMEHCGIYPDVDIFENRLKTNLDSMEVVLADKGYRYERCQIQVEEFGTARSLALRARHETFIQKLNSFSALSECFKHPLPKHVFCFHAASSVCEISVHNGIPLFDISG